MTHRLSGNLESWEGTQEGLYDNSESPVIARVTLGGTLGGTCKAGYGFFGTRKGL